MRHQNFLGCGKGRAPDAHTVIAPLHLQFGDPGFRRQVDQFSDFIYCHNGLA
jgi:hypothetical protein